MDRAASLDGLRKVHVLANLPDLGLKQLASDVTWREAAPGDIIVTHQDLSNSVFFIVAGAARAKLAVGPSRAVELRLLPAGAHFGEIAALTGSPRTVDVVAETPCLLAECPQNTFIELMGAHPGFAQAVALSLARTVASLTHRVFELAALRVRFRLYAELLRLAQGAQIQDVGLLIKELPTRDAIAATIGSQREAVTRELSALEELGVIRRRKRQLVITDIEKLRSLSRQQASLPGSESDNFWSV